MTRAVAWTEAATRDLEQAAQHIARDSPFYASTLVAEARAAARGLARFAGWERPVPETRELSVREVFVQSCRLIYHVTEERIAVLAFVHGVCDLPSLAER